MERIAGIEPAPKPWQGFILPLNYIRMESNTRLELASSLWKSEVLPLNEFDIWCLRADLNHDEMITSHPYYRYITEAYRGDSRFLFYFRNRRSVRQPMLFLYRLNIMEVAYDSITIMYIT